jgi:hypothetical protein
MLSLTFSTPVYLPLFTRYFSKRRHYAAKAHTVEYVNENTGVYFRITYLKAKSFVVMPVVKEALVEVSYVRPTCFALETEIETTALLARFPAKIHDPQIRGMGDGPYSSQGFLDGWSHANAFGVGKMLSSGAPIVTMPSQKLTESWLWNYSLPRNSISPTGHFTPRIFYAQVAGNLVTTAVWGWSVNTLLPRVDYVLLTRWVGAREKPQRVFRLVEWERVSSHLAASGFAYRENSFVVAGAKNTPALSRLFAMGAEFDLKSLNRVALADILDAEQVQQAAEERAKS